MKTAIVVVMLFAMLATLSGCATLSRASDLLVGTDPAIEVAAAMSPAGAVAPTANEPTATATRTLAPTMTPCATPTPIPLDEGDATVIVLGDPISISGPGASASGAVVTVSAGGVYRLSGALADGQIVVDASGQDVVTLVLEGVDVTSSTSAPLYVAKAEAVLIVLAEGSENRLADGAAYLYADPAEDEPDAAVFSKSDLTITGAGALAVIGNYRNGIASKDDLLIEGGQITVQAVNDALRGRDSVTITGGVFSLVAGADGIKANNDMDPEKGVVTIEGGVFQIIAGEDGIQGETRVLVRGGEFEITTGGGSANAPAQAGGMGPGRTMVVVEDSPSAKGIKAGVDLTIAGGVFHVDASDDALHSNDSITITGGALTLATGDDAIHADTSLTITDGRIDILASYEGLESEAIAISGGTMRIVASDDGINAATPGGAAGFGMRPGQPAVGQGNTPTLDISGGYIVVDALGDGVDVNGSITMSGGTLVVTGPTANMNGALDYDRGFQITGGLLVAVGSAGMAQAPDMSSTQHALMVNLSSSQPAGTLLHLAAQDGQGLLTFAPARTYQNIVFSSPELAQGETYLLYIGGSATGEAVDGLYAGGAYTGGSQAASLTLDSIVTGAGAGGGFGGGRRR
jgi:hypothetical protein